MKHDRDFRKSLLLIAFGVVLYILLQHLGQIPNAARWLLRIFSPILTGLCISFVLNVFMRRLESLLLKSRFFRKKPKVARGLSILLILLLSVGLIVLAGVVIIPMLVEGGQLIVSLLPQAGRHINEFATAFLQQQGMETAVIESASRYIANLTDQLMTLIKSSSSSIATYLMNSVMSAASSAFTIITGFLLSVYVLYHKETIQRYAFRTLERYLPPVPRRKMTRFSRVSFSIFSNFVEGQLLQSVILGLVCYIGLLLLGMPYPELISLMTALFGLIPILGGWISGIVSGLLVVATEPEHLLIFVIYFLTLQQLIGSLVYPRIVGSKMGLPSLLVIFAILIGQALFGMVGIVFCVPLAAVLYVFYKEALRKPAREEPDQQLQSQEIH